MYYNNSIVLLATPQAVTKPASLWSDIIAETFQTTKGTITRTPFYLTAPYILRIFNAAGQVVYSKNTDSTSKLSIDVTTLPSGNYNIYFSCNHTDSCHSFTVIR